MNMVRRYDIAAARNILTALYHHNPGDYQRLVAQLRQQSGMGAMGATETAPETKSTGWWDSLLSAGGNVLNTIANYKITEAKNAEDAKIQQQQYDSAVATEMKKQAALAAQAKTQAMQAQQQLDYIRQQTQLEQAAAAAKGKLQLSLVAVGGLVGLWILYRMAA